MGTASVMRQTLDGEWTAIAQWLTVASGLRSPMTTVAGLPVRSLAHPDTPPAWAFNDVAVGPSGTIYVTSDEPGVVWRLVEAPMD